ncbi:MAG: hypothetical protein R6W96_02000 [Clostridia bacterium]
MKCPVCHAPLEEYQRICEQCKSHLTWDENGPRKNKTGKLKAILSNEVLKVIVFVLFAFALIYLFIRLLSQPIF